MRQLSTTSTVAFPNVKSNFFFQFGHLLHSVWKCLKRVAYLAISCSVFKKENICFLLRVLHISYHGHIVYCIEVIVTIVLSVFAVHIVFFFVLDGMCGSEQKDELSIELCENFRKQQSFRQPLQSGFSSNFSSSQRRRSEEYTCAAALALLLPSPSGARSRPQPNSHSF